MFYGIWLIVLIVPQKTALKGEPPAPPPLFVMPLNYFIVSCKPFLHRKICDSIITVTVNYRDYYPFIIYFDYYMFGSLQKKFGSGILVESLYLTNNKLPLNRARDRKKERARERKVTTPAVQCTNCQNVFVFLVKALFLS